MATDHRTKFEDACKVPGSPHCADRHEGEGDPVVDTLIDRHDVGNGQTDFAARQAGGDQWAVIQRFQHNSPYAQAHGETDILLKGNDVRELMTEYMAQMRHTVRFMARNAEVKAQKIIWEQAPDDPGKVVRAIFERCDAVAENTQAVKESQVHAVRQSRGVGI